MEKTQIKNALNFKCEGNAITLKMYGEIGEKWWKDEEDDNIYNLTDLDKALKDHKDAATIDIYINSVGGDVFDGVAMYNMLKRHKAYKRVFIEGFACSIASVIAMCGNQVIMPPSSMLMIHNAWTVTMGNSKELRKCADDLDKVNETIKNAYRSKMKITDEQLDELMDNESYLSADECLEYGLCTKIADTIDDETVQNNVNQALDKVEGLYQNKLSSLNAIKKCIKDIEQDEVEEETVEETTEEVEETIDTVEKPTEEDSIDTENSIENENQVQEVHNIQENALMRFFNLTEEKENE